MSAATAQSSAGTFAVRLLRRANLGQRQALAGAEVLVDAATARELLREGAGRLVDEADLPRLVRLLPDSHRPRVLVTR